MPEIYGWTGKVLRINLSDRSYETIHPSPGLYSSLIGGKGLAGWFLRPFCREKWDSPEVPLLFFTGPLVNTPSPTSGRFCVMSMSPLTGTVGDSSAGGKFGTELKKAGWDGIIITGKSTGLSGISVVNDNVTFSDASGLQGKTLTETFSFINGKGSTAATGPAAENGVLFANISFDGHSFAGRNGLGLVMAAKGLKYLHVEGSGETRVFDREKLLKTRDDIYRLVSASPILKGELGISEYGTGALYDLMHSRRMMPTENFRKTQFPRAGEMNAWHYKEKYGSKKTGCAGCHILCKKKNGEGVPMPEFETMSHFSALINNEDTDLVMEASRICNEAGMDTISAASTIACYMEINGLNVKDADIPALLTDISLSKNEGELLKSGSLRYAAIMKSEARSMSVKGLELPAYDPRGAYGMALAYATSTRGGCHLRAYPVSHEILRKPVATDRFSFSGKARIIKLAEDMNAVIDSLTACKFIFFAATLEEYSAALNAVTGMSITGQDLLKAGERIFYNERIMNSLNGFTSEHDDLPERFFSSGGSSGSGINIPAINRMEFLETRRKYYIVRGLSADGLPTREKCEELGLEWTD